jgi:hypothetical protein
MMIAARARPRHHGSNAFHTLCSGPGVTTAAGVKRLLKGLIARAGYSLDRLPNGHGSIYDQDGLWTIHNHEFMQDARFAKAHARAVFAAGHELPLHWRVHIALWAASHAIKLEGDFVECGVNRGVMSSAIMSYLDWNSRDRVFYLLDTFTGLDESLLTADEVARGAILHNREHLETGRYVNGVESVRRNFSEWRNVAIVQGTIPDTLSEVRTDKVAYLHLDLNCTAPEVAAAEYLWDRLVPGAAILLDDYAYDGYRESKLGMDAFAEKHGVPIAALPTGQGLILKPPR